MASVTINPNGTKKRKRSRKAKANKRREAKGRGPETQQHLNRVSTESPPEVNARSKRPISWGNVIWLSVVHTGALAAPFFFSWQGLILTFFLHWLTGGIGVCLGYHRLFTHRSFSTH